MLDAKTKEVIVQAIINCPPELVGNVPGLVAMLKGEHPDVGEDDLFACLLEAMDALEAIAEDSQREADAIRDLAPLFEGMPHGTPLGECARIKAERGDPLAIAFLKWEDDQAGGVQ